MLLCGCTQGKRRPFKTSNLNTPILNIVGQERHFFLTKFLPLVSQDNGHIFWPLSVTERRSLDLC